MFKKIEIWIVLLLLLLFLIGTILYGSLIRHHYQNGDKFPTLQKIAVLTAEIPSKIKKLIDVMGNNMHLTVSIEPKRFSDKSSGFNIYHNEKSKNIDLLLLISRTDYDTKSQVVDLVDLKNFKILKTYRDLNKVINKIKSDNNIDRKYFILKENSIILSPYLDEDKNLIFLTNSKLIVKIDNQNNVIWFNDKFDFHHTFSVIKNKNIIWAIGCDKIKGNFNPIFEGNDYCDDSVVKIDLTDGKILESISLTEIFIKQNLHNHLFIGGDDHYHLDPLHINSVEVVQIDSNYFKKGHLFISLGHTNMILLLDPIKKEILWKISDGLFHQHDVDIINSKEIAFLNNNRIITDSDKVFKNNEINIFNFENKKISSPYNKILMENEVVTLSQGLQEFTEYGILFEEQNYGRLIFFDSEDVIFEYINKGSDNKSISCTGLEF